MRYRTETFALYAGLFKEAHQQFLKEAQSSAAAQKVPGFFRRLVQGARKSHWQDVAQTKKNLGTVSDAYLNSEAERQAAQRLAAEQTTARGAEIDTQRRMAAEHAQRLQAERDAHLAYRQQVEREMQQYGATPGALTSAQRLRNIGLGGAAIGAVGIPAAYYLGQHGAEQKGKTTRNMAFGAGAAAGLVAPQLVSGLGAIANAAGQTGLFPEMQGIGFMPQWPQGNY